MTYYTNNFNGQAGQSARAEDVNSEFDGVATGFAEVATDIAKTLRGSDAIAAMGNAAARANTWLRFDASGNPSLVSSPLNFRGAWAATTAYVVGDAYTADPNGSLYYVTTDYTSGASFGSTDTANTDLLVDLSGLFFANYQIKTASFTAAAGGSYFVDSSGGDVVITLPTGALGDSPVNITHVGGSLSAGQTITINAASGQYIMGASETSLAVDVANASMTLAYANSTYGWRLRTMG